MAKYTLTIESDDASDILNAMTVEAAPAAEAEVPAKRTRKTRVSQTATEPAASAQSVVEQVSEPIADNQVAEEDDFSDLSDEAQPVVTKQQVNDAFISLGKEKGRPAIDKIIKSLGYTKFSEIPESDYQKALNEIAKARG